MVGNKADLVPLRKVSVEEATARATEWQCPYMETSAKTRHNVEPVYSALLRMIKERKLGAKDRERKGNKGKCVLL